MLSGMKILSAGVAAIKKGAQSTYIQRARVDEGVVTFPFFLIGPFASTCISEGGLSR